LIYGSLVPGNDGEQTMKVLVVGSGGREHALCWHLSRSPLVQRLYCAPGNPGTAQHATNVPIAAGSVEELLVFALEQRIDLTMVGPEVPLCLGIRDRFDEAGLCLAGPSRGAARLEGSKAFAKEFLAEQQIPTAPFGIFTDAEAADQYIDHHAEARIVKADGLAAGKGVMVCATALEAKAVARALLGGRLGEAGRRVVVESRLMGEEASFMVLTDGRRFWPLASSQDHKAIHDGDRGPNTGGMGAYSPAPILSERLQQRIMAQVVEPTIAGMAQRNTPYQGILYVGLMISGEDFSVLEYNCRLGDPETQPVLARLKSDLVPYLLGAAKGQLPIEPPQWDPRPALCVVMTAGGYPGPYERGLPIEGITTEGHEDLMVFHAGTRHDGSRLLTDGGRVLGVTALGETIQQARDQAYTMVTKIHWPGAHFRRDIGHRAIAQREGS
jgi:phosphoribosylamine---glycine ligase